MDILTLVAQVKLLQLLPYKFKKKKYLVGLYLPNSQQCNLMKMH